MDILKKHHKEIILSTILIFGYLLTRLINLAILPIFTDEAIYLRWSQIMATDASLRFLPLTDGKPPLFFWLMIVAVKLLKNLDILFVGRLTSVVCGLIGLSGVSFAAWILFKNKKIAFLSAVCYLLTPFTFVYDRMAMADSLLAGFFVWALGLSVLIVKSGRLDVALILGMVVGFERLTKTPAIFSLILLPILFVFRPKNIFKVIGLFILSAGISEMFYSVLRLFPLFNMIAAKNSDFTITMAEFLRQPFGLLFGNLQSLIYWEYFYLTLPVVMILFFGIYRGMRKNFVETVILLSFFLFPLIAMATFNKVIYPRYLLMFTMPLLILGAYGLSYVKNFLFYILIFSFSIFTISMLIINPNKAPLLQADRDQYIDGWAAGYGVNEIRQYLHNKSGVIATEGTFGLMPFSLELYQKEYPNLQIKSYWPLPEKQVSGTNYLLMYQKQTEPTGWKLQEIMRFKQGNSNDYLRLYKVL